MKVELDGELIADIDYVNIFMFPPETKPEVPKRSKEYLEAEEVERTNRVLAVMRVEEKYIVAD